MISNEANNYYYIAVKNLSELNSSGWLRVKKKAIINNSNNNNKNNNNNNNSNNNNEFENALDDTLNYLNIETHPEKISNTKPYINKYNWKVIKFPAEPEEWKKFERNNKTIALNALYVQYNTKRISVAYRSEYNNKRKRQVILLMITNGKKSHYLTVTNLSALLQGKSPNHYGDLYCLNCLNSYTSKINL